jgi:hypothetical protein
MNEIRKALSHLRCPQCSDSTRRLRLFGAGTMLFGFFGEVAFWFVFVVLATALQHVLNNFVIGLVSFSLVLFFAFLIERKVSRYRCTNCRAEWSFDNVVAARWLVLPNTTLDQGGR